MTVRVLLADDQDLVRAGLAMILDATDDLQLVGEAAHGAEAVELSGQLRPDVVLMDVRMPGLDGIEATRRIVCAGETAPRVLVLTTFDLDEYVVAAFRAGASGFLLKDAPRQRIADGIRAVAAGEALVAPSVTRRLVERYVATGTGAGRQVPGLEQLTPREREVLGLLGRGLSNAELAERLFVSEKTVKTHVEHVLAKLRIRDRVQAVIVAYEAGIVVAGQA